MFLHVGDSRSGEQCSIMPIDGMNKPIGSARSGRAVSGSRRPGRFPERNQKGSLMELEKQ